MDEIWEDFAKTKPERTVKDVYESFNEEQLRVLHIMVGYGIKSERERIMKLLEQLVDP